MWCSGIPGETTQVSSAAAEKTHVELLTGTWLGLYFLGESFNHPWERARRWAARDGGGLPNGACVAKAVGEIVRSARIAGKRHSLSPPPEPKEATTGALAKETNSQLMVLSYLPLPLFKNLLRGKEKKGCTPDACHVLGRCYELLQLRLYANEGLPFKYFVPRELVQSQLTSDQDASLRDMLTWLCDMVFTQKFDGQYVSLVNIPILPAVFLNHSEGLYTFETLQDAKTVDINIPLPASYMRDARRKLYRETLNSIQVGEFNNLLDLGREPYSPSIRERILGP